MEQSREIWYLDELIDIFKNTSISKSQLYQSMCSVKEQQISELRSLISTSEQQYENSGLKHVSEIEYSPDIKNEKVIDKNRFLLRMNDGNYVYINLANMDNLNKYEEIYTTLDENKKGILNLDSTSKGVVFQPFDLIKEKEETKDELSE